MSLLNQANDISTTLNGSITNSATSITVTSGANFPAVPFTVRVDAEAMLVTSVGTGTNWTVTRASEPIAGTQTAVAHSSGAEVRHVSTAAWANSLPQLQSSSITTQTGALAIDGSGTGDEAVSGTTNVSGKGGIAGFNTNKDGYGVYGTQTGAAGSGAGVYGVGGLNNTGGMFVSNGAAYGLVSSNTSSGGAASFTSVIGATLYTQTGNTAAEAIIAHTTQSNPTAAAVSVTDTVGERTRLNFDGTVNGYISPNYIMNGDMLVNQRFGPAGTLAIATGAQNKYMVDRWHLDKDGTSQGTLSQVAFTVGQTDVPNEPQYYLDWNHSTAGTGGTKDNIQHNIESVRTLAGKQVTFSIYMKVASGTQAVTLELEQNFGSGGSASVLYTKGSTDTVTTTFQRFTYTVTLSGISGKTLGTAFTDSLIVRVKNPLNAAYQISYAHAQLELGPLATPYRVEDYGVTSARCKRYFDKSFDDTVAVAANNAARGGEVVIIQVGGAATTMRTFVPFRTTMRIAPTVTLYNSQANNNQIRNATAGADWTASSSFSVGTNAFTITGTTAAGSGAGQISIVGWGAEADY